MLKLSDFGLSQCYAMLVFVYFSLLSAIIFVFWHWLALTWRPNNFSEPKTIIKDISGEFRSSELSAILGPSGGGKSTLLNILTGFIARDVQGSIKINGKKRNEEKFRKNSTYIMQEENLYELLTLRETMKFAIRLKTKLRDREKIDSKTMDILGNLGLETQLDTLVKNLSGGQKRRWVKK